MVQFGQGNDQLLHFEVPDALVSLVDHILVQVLHNRGLKDT